MAKNTRFNEQFRDAKRELVKTLTNSNFIETVNWLLATKTTPLPKN